MSNSTEISPAKVTDIKRAAFAALIVVLASAGGLAALQFFSANDYLYIDWQQTAVAVYAIAMLTLSAAVILPGMIANAVAHR